MNENQNNNSLQGLIAAATLCAIMIAALGSFAAGRITAPPPKTIIDHSCDTNIENRVEVILRNQGIIFSVLTNHVVEVNKFISPVPPSEYDKSRSSASTSATSAGKDKPSGGVSGKN